MTTAESDSGQSKVDMSPQAAATEDLGGVTNRITSNGFEDAGRPRNHNLVQTPPNHSSADLSPARPYPLPITPSPPQFVIQNVDDRDRGAEAVNQHVYLDISSDDCDASVHDKDETDDDVGSATDFTSPASQLSQTNRHLQRGPNDRFLGTPTARFNPHVRNVSTVNSIGASATLKEEGRALFRAAVIDGLEPADYTKERPTPTVISDAGIQQFKGQRNDNIKPSSSILASHETLETLLFSARHLAQHPHSEPWTQGEGFIPKKQLDNIVTEESVIRELHPYFSGRFNDQEISEYARYICGNSHFLVADGRFKLKSYKPVLALLAMFKKTDQILKFLDEDVSDLDLPLINIFDSRDGRHRIGRRSRTSKSGDFQSTPLRCFSEWNRIESETFLRYQWMMLSPFFTESGYNDIQHYELHNSHILPWTNESLDGYTELEGGFATVFPVRIHEEHHNFGDPEACSRGFAIKQLLDKDPIKFKREVTILQKFVGENAHPHIVSLLATYRHCGKYHMIFYRAQGDLFKYWKVINSAPSFDPETIAWVAKQCEGISHGLVQLHRHRTFSETEDAVSKIPVSSVYRTPMEMHSRETVHRASAARKQASLNQSTQERIGQARKRKRSEDEYGNEPKVGDPEGTLQFGRHGDLKPENILWFEGGEGNRGTLKIADFGQAELHEWQSMTRKLSEVADTMAYRSPESHFDGKRFQQSSDIWSLGCVFLVFVTWTLGGAELVMKFARIRSSRDEYWGVKSDTFFEISRSTERVDSWSVVVKPAVVQFIHDLHTHARCSAYIHEILDLIYFKMLVIEIQSANKRLSCIQVFLELKKLRKKCCRNKDYATLPSPWKAQDATPLPSSPVHFRLPTVGAMESMANKNL